VVTTQDKYLCQATLHKETHKKENYKFTLGETYASPKHRPSSSTATMVALEKEANNHHT
jgi:hypothetical protein